MNKDYTICIIASHAPHQEYYCFNSFLKSLDGEPLTVLGWGTGEYKNLSDRPRIFYNAIKARAIKTKNLILSDCWDMVFVDSPEIVFEKHKANNCDITFSAEKNPFPSEAREQFDAIAPVNTSYKYLNCGTIVGKTEAILTMLEDMDAPNLPVDYFIQEEQKMFHYNEQKFYMDSFFRQPVSMKLDYSQDIANCMQDVTMDEISMFGGGSMETGTVAKIRNKETNSIPSIIHWNGSSKTAGTMEPILKHLNLL